VNEQIQTPLRVSYSNHTFHQYTIRVKNQKRNSLSEHLTQNRIGNSIYYPIPCHLQKAVAHLGFAKGEFPKAESAAEEVLSLPIFPGIAREEQDYVVQAIKRWATH